MERRGIVLIVAVGAALAMPARAYAVDHLVLDISPAGVAAPVSAKASKQERARVKALAPWRLDGRVVGRDFYRLVAATSIALATRRSSASHSPGRFQRAAAMSSTRFARRPNRP